MKNSCKIVTWNINGLKKLVQQGIPNAFVPTGEAISLNSVLLSLDADIIAFQETKVGGWHFIYQYFYTVIRFSLKPNPHPLFNHSETQITHNHHFRSIDLLWMWLMADQRIFMLSLHLV